MDNGAGRVRCGSSSEGQARDEEAKGSGQQHKQQEAMAAVEGGPTGNEAEVVPAPAHLLPQEQDMDRQEAEAADMVLDEAER